MASYSTHPLLRGYYTLLTVVMLGASACCGSAPSKGGILVAENAAILTDVEPTAQLQFEIAGEGNPVILLHGFGANRSTWSEVWPRLADNFKVYLIDLKGFGESDKPRDGRYDVLDHARNVLDLIENEDLTNVTLVGHSLGGGISLVLAVHDMQAGHNRIASLVLVDSAAYSQKYPAFLRILQTPVIGEILQNLVPVSAQVKATLKEAYYDDSKITEKRIANYVKPLKSKNGRYAARTTARQLQSANVDLIATYYAQLNLSVLLIWGANDSIVPLSIGSRLNEELLNSDLHVLDRTGHNAHEERGEEVTALILQFLGIPSEH